MRIIKSIVIVVLFVFGSQLLEGADRGRIEDKTLVVWTAPANLSQQGGSALTIDNLDGNFDGIVFGEIAKTKWMAGSDLYRRRRTRTRSLHRRRQHQDQFTYSPRVEVNLELQESVLTQGPRSRKLGLWTQANR